MMVSSSLVRTDRMRSSDSGSSPLMKFKEGMVGEMSANNYGDGYIRLPNKPSLFLIVGMGFGILGYHVS
jgi:hypothetical protein